MSEASSIGTARSHNDSVTQFKKTIEDHELLMMILMELRRIRMHIEDMTDEEITPEDLQ